MLLALLPGLDGALEYNRDAVESGELWRLLSAQFVHWTFRMTIADLGVLLALGSWVEINSRRLALVALITGGILIGLGLHFLIPNLEHYRGSSGLASALFIVVALDPASSSPRKRARPLAVITSCLFVLKLLWELRTGAAIAAGPLLPGVAVVPQAHLLGGVAGLLAFVTHRQRRRRRNHGPICVSRVAPALPVARFIDS